VPTISALFFLFLDSGNLSKSAFFMSSRPSSPSAIARWLNWVHPLFEQVSFFFIHYSSNECVHLAKHGTFFLHWVRPRLIAPGKGAFFAFVKQGRTYRNEKKTPLRAPRKIPSLPNRLKTPEMLCRFVNSPVYVLQKQKTVAIAYEASQVDEPMDPLHHLLAKVQIW